MRNKIKKFFLSCTAAALSASLFCTQLLTSLAEESVEERLERHRAMEIQSNNIDGWPTGPVVSAESAILMEASTGTILYSKNIHQQQYPASTTKILTTLLATELCELNEVVDFSYKAVHDNPPGSSGIAMDVGQKLTVEQCLNAILIRSANECAFAIAEHISGTDDWSVFADTMNKRAEELGALNTHFANPNGLPDENHYTTAYDLAMIGRGFFANKMLCDISLTRRMEIPASDYLPEAKVELSSMQIIPGGKYEYEYLVGCKTGYTVAARSSLVSCAEKDGLKLICVVMHDESPLQYEDTIALYNYGFSNFTKLNVSQTETKYNIEASDRVYGGSDIFGTAAPLLELNKDDCIVLPKNLTIADTQSAISYNTGNSNVAAVISYTYRGVELGEARLNFTAEAGEGFAFGKEVLGEETPESTQTPIPTESPKEKDSSVSFQKILKIACLVLLALAVLAFIFIVLYRFVINRPVYLDNGNNRRSWRRRRRRRRSNRPPKRNRDYNF